MNPLHPSGTQKRKIVVFDLGGTLVDERGPQMHPVPESVLNNLKLEGPLVMETMGKLIRSLMEENERKVGGQIPARIIIQNSLKNGAVVADVSVLEDIAWHMMGGNQSTYLSPLSHASELLNTLKKNNVTIAALSNTALPLSLLERMLELHGIANCFDAVVLSSECGWRKPSAGAFEALEKHVGYCHTDEIVFVGNCYEADIAPASARGYFTVYIKSPDEQLTEAQKRPDVTINHLGEVCRELQNHLNWRLV